MNLPRASTGKSSHQHTRRARRGCAAIAFAAGLVVTGVGAAAQPSTAPAAAAATATTRPAGQAELPVRAVVLYSSGVGYFQHVGRVTGNATAELPFKTAQINDMLKSLVLQDKSETGRVDAVVYPSQDPIGKTLKSFQIDITSNPSLAELLNQLRGAKVRLSVNTERLEGTILGLEKKPKTSGDKQVIEVWVINLISDGAIRAIELNDVNRIELEDPQLQEELNKALAALAQSRDQDKKPVTISFKGQGERDVVVGYVVETPVWKSSYRLILPADAAAKPQLQGWAIIENQTDNDWNDVQLSLVSGRPISFIQELYQPLYIPRPVVMPELYASLRPQTYDAGMEKDKAQGIAGKSEMGFRLDGGAPAAPAAPARRQSVMNEEAGAARAGEQDRELQIDPTKSIMSVASASKIGELFQYTIASVTLPRQRSAMIPIVTDAVEVEKVSIYSQSVLPRNPLNGARVKNTTGKHLLAGPVTVLDGSAYAGDARIDNVPPDQERLLSYGVDLQMLVDAVNNRTDSAIRTGTIIKGVLQLTWKYEFAQEYVAENKGTLDKVLIVEHPRRGAEVKLVSPEKADEKTDAVYRFRVAVAAGKKASLMVKEENIAMQALQILSADTPALEIYARNGAIPRAVRDALQEAIAKKGALVELQRTMNDLQRQRNDLTADQARTRENMRLFDKGDASFRKWATRLSEQDAQMDALAEKIEGTQNQIRQGQRDLEAYLSGLNVEEKPATKEGG